jgi:hypothetical protein
MGPRLASFDATHALIANEIDLARAAVRNGPETRAGTVPIITAPLR